jgi:hypothetical protein
VADIKKNGLNETIDLCEGKILDGRNRYQAAKAAGIKLTEANFIDWESMSLEWARALVISKNLKRRHLTTEDRKRIATEVLKWQPERSDRSVAKEVGLSDTVAAVRKSGEASAEIPQMAPTDRVDAGGRKRARKTPAKPKSPKKKQLTDWLTTEQKAAETVSELPSARLILPKSPVTAVVDISALARRTEPSHYEAPLLEPPISQAVETAAETEIPPLKCLQKPLRSPPSPSLRKCR